MAEYVHRTDHFRCMITMSLEENCTTRRGLGSTGTERIFEGSREHKLQQQIWVKIYSRINPVVPLHPIYQTDDKKMGPVDVCT
jgi:hypothetical protein